MAAMVIKLFGELAIVHGNTKIDHFSTRYVGGILAYLALNLDVAVSREVLFELFWQGDTAKKDPTASLRGALNSLKKLLEPPGISRDSILETNQFTVRLNKNNVTTDVVLFESLLKRAEAEKEAKRRLSLLEEAITLYTGELVPGHYEDYFEEQRKKWNGKYLEALEKATTEAERCHHWLKAAGYAQTLMLIEEFSEEKCALTMRLFEKAGYPNKALQAYQKLDENFKSEGLREPSAGLQQLAEKMRLKGGTLRRRRTLPPRPKVFSSVSSEASADRLQISSPFVSTQLFGREEEIERLKVWLLPTNGTQAPFVTITGMAGIGKTHLANQVGHALEQAYPKRVFYVGLEEVNQAVLILPTIASCLLTPNLRTNDPLADLITFFADHPALLIIDNLEQLLVSTENAKGLPDSISIIQDLYKQLPSVALLLTSREATSLPMEISCPLSPLALPAHGLDKNLQDVMNNPCVQMYVDRASKKVPEFQVTKQNAFALVELMRCLEGMPLAIEIIASWVKTMPPKKMLEAIQSAFDIPQNKFQGVPTRHRSLSAALEQSYRLLALEIQTLFARLSVFRGGWTVAAAEGICQETQLAYYLSRLVDSSLVIVEEYEGTIRYRMLQTVRDFARMKLAEREENEQLREYHAVWFSDFAKQFGQDFLTAKQDQSILALGQDMENLRAALHWSLETEARLSIGMEMMAAIEQYWFLTDKFSEGRTLLMPLVQRVSVLPPSKIRGELLRAVGTLACVQSDFAEAQKILLQGRADFTFLKEELDVASIDNALANIAFEMHHLQESEAYHESCLATYRQHDIMPAVAQSLNNLGNTLFQQGKLTESINVLLESRSSWEQMNHHPKWSKLDTRPGRAMTANSLGRVYLFTGHLRLAQACFEESWTLHHQFKPRPLRDIAYLLHNRGYMFIAQEHFMEALADLQECARIRREDIGDRQGLASCRRTEGIVHYFRKDFSPAIECFTESLHLFLELKNRPAIAQTVEWFGILRAAQGLFSEAAWCWGIAEGLWKTFHEVPIEFLRDPELPVEHQEHGIQIGEAKRYLSPERYETEKRQAQSTVSADWRTAVQSVLHIS